MSMKKILTLIYLLTLNTLVFGQTQDWFSDIITCEDTTIAFPSNITSDSTFVWFFENNPITNNSDSSITISESGMYSLFVYNTSETLNDSFIVIVDVVDPDFMLTFTDSDINVDSLVNMCLEDNPILTTPNSLEDNTHFWYLDGSPIGADTLSGRTLNIEDIIDEVNFNQEYEYHVEIENACGIYPSKNTVTMVVNECHCALDMPNVFTPNNDEFNNEFKPINNHELETEAERICESTDFAMTVFNQWGRHMATIESKDEYPSWDGLNKRGNEVPEGVYFYNIVYQVNVFTLPKEKSITGFVHLYR